MQGSLLQARGCTAVMHSGTATMLAHCWVGWCRSQASNRMSVTQHSEHSRTMPKVGPWTQPGSTPSAEAAPVLVSAQADDSSSWDIATTCCKCAGPEHYCTSNPGCHRPQWCSSRPPGHWMASDSLHPSGWQTLDGPTCSQTANCLLAGAQAPLRHQLHNEATA